MSPVRAAGPPPTLFRGVRTPSRPEAAEVAFLDGQVAEAALLATGGRTAAGAEVVEGDGRWLLPGWIDLQVNDIEWIAAGPRSAAEHAERIRRVVRHQAAGGVTGLALATLAAPLEEVLAYLEGAARVRRQAAGLEEAFLGVLVEGTFMNPSLCGAHNPLHVRAPDPDLLDRLLDTGGVRLVNIAPEASPEALEAIRRATRRGAVVGCGHAKPSGERVRQAVEAGLSYVIHLGNGPTGSSLKGFSEGGLLEEALRNDRVIATLILDGVHLDRRLVRDIIARKEPSRVAGVSDAGFALGAPREAFTAFGVRGEPSPDGRYLRVLPREGSPSSNPLSSDVGALFGSTADMRQVFENVLNWLSIEMEGIYHRRHPALPLGEALRAAVELVSATPARLLGDTGRGRLEPGCRADAVLASLRGDRGSYRVEVEAVWVGGRRVPRGGPHLP